MEGCQSDEYIRAMHFDEKPTLTTARLRLRAVTYDDVANLLALDADVEVRRYVDMPTAPSFSQIRDAYIPRWQEMDATTPHLGYWMADLVEEKFRFVGWFHLRPPAHDHSLKPDDLELGYRLRLDRWGMGLATEGSRCLLDFAFDQLQSPRVVATALSANKGSVRVMEKLGMTLDHSWLYKDHLPAVSYAITAEQWAQQKNTSPASD